MADKIRIVSKVEGFRRGGVAHSSEATFHDPEDFTKEQAQALQDEPNLIIDLVDVDDEPSEGPEETGTKTPVKKAPAKK